MAAKFHVSVWRKSHHVCRKCSMHACMGNLHVPNTWHSWLLCSLCNGQRGHLYWPRWQVDLHCVCIRMSRLSYTIWDDAGMIAAEYVLVLLIQVCP
jgi:hypothetical protein